MFKITTLSFIGLFLLTSQVLAQTFICADCSDPYTSNGQQTYANFAHNTAWGGHPNESF